MTKLNLFYFNNVLNTLNQLEVANYLNLDTDILGNISLFLTNTGLQVNGLFFGLLLGFDHNWEAIEFILSPSHVDLNLYLKIILLFFPISGMGSLILFANVSKPEETQEVQTSIKASEKSRSRNRGDSNLVCSKTKASSNSRKLDKSFVYDLEDRSGTSLGILLGKDPSKLSTRYVADDPVPYKGVLVEHEIRPYPILFPQYRFIGVPLKIRSEWNLEYLISSKERAYSGFPDCNPQLPFKKSSGVPFLFLRSYYDEVYLARHDSTPSPSSSN